MAKRKHHGGDDATESADQGETDLEGGGEAGDPEARREGTDDHEGAGENAGGSGAGSQAAEEAQQPPERKVDPAAADVLGKYPAVEEIAGAMVCEVEDANGVKERKVLARVHDGRVQLTPDGQFIWDTEFRQGT